VGVGAGAALLIDCLVEARLYAPYAASASVS